MTVVTLSDEQTRLIGNADSPIVLVDSSGRRVGTVSPSWLLPPEASKDEVVAEIRRRMASDDGRRLTHAEVMSHLRSLGGE